MGDIFFGIELLVVGMVLLFAAMALLIIVMVALERVFRPQPPLRYAQEPNETEAVKGDKEIAAIIAVALAKARSIDISQDKRSGIGAFLKAGRGLWWTKRNIQEEGRRLR